jgi:DNA-binding beta-propeller fold protein YncE
MCRGIAAAFAAAFLAVSSPAVRPALGRQDVVQINVAAEIEAQIEKARTFIREESRFEEALNLLAPLIAKLFRVTDAKKQMDLSAEIFLLKALAYAGLSDDVSARREFRNLFELGADVAKSATRNIFDTRILLLLKQAERESQGLSIDFTLGIITDPPGAAVRVNGRDAGTTPMIYKTPKAEKVALEVAKLGYKTVQDEVVVDQYELRRDYVLEFVGMTLVVRSKPPGAKVLLDGRDTGLVTNGELSGIDLGRHQVKLVKENYKDWETWIDSAEGKTAFNLEANLVGTGYASVMILTGPAQNPLRAPTAVAVDRDGNFVVADTSDRKIAVFDNVLRTMMGWDPGLIAEMGLVLPQGIAVDSRNRYFVTDAEKHSVFVLNEPGKAPVQWGRFGAGDDQFNTPLGIAIDGRDNVYIADSGNNRVKKHSGDGRLVKAWTMESAPRAVAVGPAGEIYVLDSQRIQKFSSEGELKGSLASEAGFADPRGLGVDASGFVYVADAGLHRIVKLDEGGEVVTSWGGEGAGPGQLAAPVGVAVDSQGRVVVVERGNNRIQVFALGSEPRGPSILESGAQPRRRPLRIDGWRICL